MNDAWTANSWPLLRVLRILLFLCVLSVSAVISFYLLPQLADHKRFPPLKKGYP